MIDKPTIIYIAGYGRSGSTILDITMGSHPKVASAGELTYLFDELISSDAAQKKRICSCGEAYENCPVWGEVLAELNLDIHEAARIIRGRDKRKLLLLPAAKAMGNGNGGHIRDDYAKITKNIFSAIARIQNVDYIVDSSKTAREAAYRPIAIAREAKLPVKVVHLVRSPVDTYKSIAKIDNWKAEGHGRNLSGPTLRAIPGWLIANINAYRLKSIVGNKSYVLVKYENLISDPKTEYERMGNILGLDFSETVARILSEKPFRTGHNVGGNRVRLKKEIIIKTKASV